MAANYDVDIVLRKETIIFCMWLLATVLVLYLTLPLIKDAWQSMQDAEIGVLETSKKFQGRVTLSTDKAYGDYTLITERFSPHIFLIDMEGRVVHHWIVPVSDVLKNYPKRKKNKSFILFDKAYVYPNGDVLVIASVLGLTPYGHQIFKLNKNSKLLWGYERSIHHDFYISEDRGLIFTLGQSLRNKIPSDIDTYTPTLADSIEILSPKGKLIRRIDIINAFSGTEFAHYIKSRDGIKEDWDVLHANSVMRLDSSMAAHFPQFKVGSILVSIRSQHLLAVIDPETKKVVWAKKGEWYAQHDAKFLENGNILLFDNQGIAKKQEQEKLLESLTRVVEIDPDTGLIVWEYPKKVEDSFSSSFLGRSDRLPNGNTLITDALNHRVFEIDSEEKTVWNFIIPDKNNKTVSVYGQKHRYGIRSAIRYTKAQLPFLHKKKKR
jgi:hypothetical protein